MSAPAVARARFAARFGRHPVAPDEPSATINDFIFARMIDPCWSPSARAFVDKATAKAAARRIVPDMSVAETIAILPMTGIPSSADLAEALRPYYGTRTVAKPTNASGAVIFLRNGVHPADIRSLFDLASRDYADALHELQYRGLPRHVIVEAEIRTPHGRPPDDYKFHCARGRPIVCQIDHDRFGTPWSRLFGVPGFAPMDPEDGLEPPASFVRTGGERLDRMIAAARRLSTPFDFVRVDLYDDGNAVCFGELTFTPAAALGIAPSAQGDHCVNDTHRLYSELMMAGLRCLPRHKDR